MHECMQINKYHVVALHLTCMGTSRISGVNAQCDAHFPGVR